MGKNKSHSFELRESGCIATLTLETYDDTTCEEEPTPLYSVEIDGLVTWADLEALARLFHPKGMTAMEHARKVQDVKWQKAAAP
jgi:hypothetical protein